MMDNANWWIGLLIVVVVFLLAREFMCWYWKINTMVSSLQNIEEQLKQLNQKRTNPPA